MVTPTNTVSAKPTTNPAEFGAANLLPVVSAKTTLNSAVGFAATGSRGGSSQSIFFKGPLGKDGSFTATMKTGQSAGKPGSTLTTTAEAEYTPPGQAGAITNKLRAKLDAVQAPGKPTAVTGTAYVSVNAKLTQGPGPKLSATLETGLNTNGVLSTALTLQADQKLGTVVTNLQAVVNQSGVVAFVADAKVPLDNNGVELNLSAKQVVNGGFEGGAGFRLNF